MYYDSHTHLNDSKLFPERQDYLNKFREIGGQALVNIGAGNEFNLRAIEIAQIFKNKYLGGESSPARGGCKLRWGLQEGNSQNFVKATIGLYPFDIISGEITEKNITESIQNLKKLYQENSDLIIGIGECGVDLYYEDLRPHLDLQQKLFAAQLDLAQELDLPIIIHSRAAFDETFAVVKNYKNLKIYFHCRGYGSNEIQKLQNYFPNFRAGFCGNVSYPKAEKLRESLKVVNPESILFETDAPYLTPQKLRGTTNHPANVQYIYQFAAELLGKDLPVLQKEIEENFWRLYS